MKKRVIGGIVIAAVAFGAWWLLRPRTPKGQEPLMSLTAQNFGDFQKQFDAAAGQTRIVALLYPT